MSRPLRLRGQRRTSVPAHHPSTAVRHAESRRRRRRGRHSSDVSVWPRHARKAYDDRAPARRLSRDHPRRPVRNRCLRQGAIRGSVPCVDRRLPQLRPRLRRQAAPSPRRRRPAPLPRPVATRCTRFLTPCARWERQWHRAGLAPQARARSAATAAVRLQAPALAPVLPQA